MTDRASCLFDEPKNAHAGVAAAVGKNIRLTAGETACAEFALSFAAQEKAALMLPYLPLREPQPAAALRVHSADPQFDRMVNTWLPWQARKCRFEGRTGFYQCGGAWGFRDQLQDASAFLLTDPALARRHLLRCAAVQFEQGDVLHWWHRLPPQDGGLRGVRTRYRDDLLWLPWLAAEYVRATDDCSVLDVPVPYLAAEPLTDNETERYFAPARTASY
jgi:cyclic beta-1,2-glucan synthetase